MDANLDGQTKDTALHIEPEIQLKGSNPELTMTSSNSSTKAITLTSTPPTAITTTTISEEKQAQTDVSVERSSDHNQPALDSQTSPLVSTFESVAIEEPVISIKKLEIEIEESKHPITPHIGTIDNGIFEFMSPDRAIELYKSIHCNGPPELDWKFYGRRKPGEQEGEEVNESISIKEDVQNHDQNPQGQLNNTEFDFDEEFGNLQPETSIVNESLRLKKRPESGSEKKTNLSDIMSDIMKESHAENE